MKTLGIVGGIGPESTIEYYRFILDGYRARVTDGSAPPPDRQPRRQPRNRDAGRERSCQPDELHFRLGRKPGASGRRDRTHRCEHASPCVRRSPAPIADSDAQHRAGSLRACAKSGLCTGRVARHRLYHASPLFSEVFARAGVELVAPNEAEQAVIHTIYIGELLKNQFLPESCNAILAIIERLREEERVEAILLAGTELPLLLRDAGPEDIPLLDTTVIHVGAAVDAIVK